MHGMHVHEAVVAAGEPETGITIHLVDEQYDHGKTLFQARCEVLPCDTALDVAAKIHLLEQEHPYTIVEEVRLSHIDYENFTTDFLADREFIEENADLCSKGEVWSCLLVQQRGRSDGVLVIPYDLCFVEYAAYLSSVN